jgi:hypothetical protein
MSSNPLQAACAHTTMGHMFYNILCPNQSLTTRVTTVVLGGMLLVGAIFAASKYFLRPSYPEVPEVGEQTIQSTIDNLNKNYTSTTPFKFSGYPPVNTQILLLRSLYSIHLETFQEVLKRHQDNPWDQEEVLQVADTLMKNAFTLSCLSLDDLKPFTEKLKTDGRKPYAQLLEDPSVYMYYTLTYSSEVYHWIRGGILWDENKQGYYYPDGNEAYAQLFYKKGTKQYFWNQLYTHYSNRIKSDIIEQNFNERFFKWSKRLINWTTKDTGIDAFKPYPDTDYFKSCASARGKKDDFFALNKPFYKTLPSSSFLSLASTFESITL